MNQARSSLAATLAAASSALSAGRYGDMATSLRAVWRESRDPILAGIYELLMTRMRGGALAGRDPVERVASWRERAERARGEPLVLPILIAEPWHGDLPELERLRLLARWTPDPLLAAALARRLRVPLVPRDQPGHLQIAVETVRLLAAQGDPRQLETLQWLSREPGLGAELRRQLRGAVVSVEAVRVLRLSDEARAATSPLEQRAREQREHERRTASLLEAVHADPEADAPRLVYADWLTGHGDPRGEFIALQIERHQSGAPASERERELLVRHEYEWSGELHGVLGSAGRVFERGFLTAASVEAGTVEGEIVDSGEWSTLRSLDGHVGVNLALRGRLDHLRRLYGFLDLERFVALRAAGRLGAVEHYECSLADPNLRFDTPLGLRSLLVRRGLDERLVELLDSPACAGLEEFAIYYDSGAFGASNWTGDHRVRPSLRSRWELLGKRLPGHVRRLRMIDGRTSRASRPEGCELCFARDEAGALSLLRVDLHPSKPGRVGIGARAVVELLAALPLAELSQVSLGRVEGGGDREVLREGLVELGVELGASSGAG
jgi:uncharacterized protein (TIGR02996 family)